MPEATSEASDEAIPGPPLDPETARIGRGWPGGLLASWAYLVVVLTAVWVIHGQRSEWPGWMAVRFVPRGVFLLPLPILGILGLRGRRRSSWIPLLVTAGLIAGPLMGFVAPMGGKGVHPESGERVVLGTLNLGIGAVQGDRIRRWVDERKIDVLCLQEHRDDPPDYRTILGPEWHGNGNRSVVSRWPIVREYPGRLNGSETAEFVGGELDLAEIRTPSGRTFVVGSIHLPTLRHGFVHLMHGDWAGYRSHVDWWRLKAHRAAARLRDFDGTPVVLAGDFNVPPDERGMDLFRPTFRSAFDLSGWGYGYTRPTTFPWVRIDHILASRGWGLIRSEVGPDVGSDHLPLSAEIRLNAEPGMAVAP